MKLIEQYNDKLSELYDDATKGEFDWTPPRKTWEIMQKLVKPGMKVLDIGIGTGQSAEPFIKEDCNVYGFDISSKMLDIAKKKFSQIQTFKTDIEDDFSCLEGHLFDIVIAIGVLEFAKDLEPIFKNVYKILKPKGKFCFTFEELLLDHELQKEPLSETGKIGEEPVPEILRFPTFRHSWTDIEEIIRRNKLRILHKESFRSYYKSKRKIPIYYGILLTEKSN